MAADLSIIIPYYNRADTIGASLASVAAAQGDWRLEIILVDDGSPEPAAEALTVAEHQQVARLIRQENQGLLLARLAGFQAATGDFVLFLDSDDLVGPEKFNHQLTEMRAHALDVTYSDSAVIDLALPVAERRPVSHNVAESTTSSQDFFIRIQPAPHSPIFRRSYLSQVLLAPAIEPSARFNPVAEVWFYLNAAFHPATVAKCAGWHTLVGRHSGARITNHWERMGFAATALITEFFRACGRKAVSGPARQIMASCVFHSWRALPYDYAPALQAHLLKLWRLAPRPAQAVFGGKGFTSLARLCGPVGAGRILRRLRGHNYTSCRTIDEDELQQLITQLPELP